MAIAKAAADEATAIPPAFDYGELVSLSREGREKLARAQPRTRHGRTDPR